MRTESQKMDVCLVSGAAKGSEQAVSTLYERHCVAMLKVAQRILGNSDDANDLLHDAFMEAWQHANDYRSHQGTVRAWLLMRVRSRALDRLRARKRHPSHIPDDDTELPATTCQVDLADLYRIQRVLQSMPLERRTVLQLFYIEGMSSTEVAAQLRIPTGTVKSRLRIGLEELRRELALDEDERRH